ncbi:hypothetical protein NDU88_005621 [Pleurodeles waltl]|uniref:Uncharacterized protein n=1 Tax=Pleurodeles waltl TaxID=8319 RepID=A0AAV7LLQ7_PLEWA|nr:hypothetical protein NDU88_005621 [Pleurodeles waltl]
MGIDGVCGAALPTAPAKRGGNGSETGHNPFVCCALSRLASITRAFVTNGVAPLPAQETHCDRTLSEAQALLAPQQTADDRRPDVGGGAGLQIVAGPEAPPKNPPVNLHQRKASSKERPGNRSYRTKTLPCQLPTTLSRKLHVMIYNQESRSMSEELAFRKEVKKSLFSGKKERASSDCPGEEHSYEV